MKREDFARKLCAIGSSFKDIICDHIAFEAFPEMHQTAEGKQCWSLMEFMAILHMSQKCLLWWFGLKKDTKKISKIDSFENIWKSWTTFSGLNQFFGHNVRVHNFHQASSWSLQWWIQSSLCGQKCAEKCCHWNSCNIPIKHNRNHRCMEFLACFDPQWCLILYCNHGFSTFNEPFKKCFNSMANVENSGLIASNEKTHTHSRPSKVCLCQWCRLSSHARSFLTAPVEFGLHQSPFHKETAFPKLIA